MSLTGRGEKMEVKDLEREMAEAEVPKQEDNIMDDLMIEKVGTGNEGLVGELNKLKRDAATVHGKCKTLVETIKRGLGLNF